jgi:hypothetical protein
MDIKEIYEAIYASSNGVIVERRKSIVVPILLILVGVALFVLNYFIDNGADANNLKSSIVLVGAGLMLLGGLLGGIAIFGEGLPYHKADKCFLVRKQYSFDHSQQQEVKSAVNSGDKSKLDAVKESDIAGILAVCYYSPKGNFTAMQAFAYDELDYKPITEVKIRA